MGKDHRYTIRLDPNIPNHIKVGEIFDSMKGSRGDIRALIVDAVLAYTSGKTFSGVQGSANLRDTVRAVLDELGIKPGDMVVVTGTPEVLKTETPGVSEKEKIEPVDRDLADLVDSNLRGFGV